MRASYITSGPPPNRLAGKANIAIFAQSEKVMALLMETKGHAD
jgi:hypothetical protein